MGRRPAPSRSRLPIHQRVLRDPAAVRYWLLVTAAALVLATGVGHVVGRAESTREGWGQTEVVQVLTRSVRAGDPLDDAFTESRWPRSLVPDAAIDELADGATANGDLDAGTPLTASQVQDPSTDAATDERTIAIPLGDAVVPLRPGDRVDVWATVDPSLVADGGVATRRVAIGARVTDMGDEAAVLRVESGQVAEVAEAVATATITLVGRG